MIEAAQVGDKRSLAVGAHDGDGDASAFAWHNHHAARVDGVAVQVTQNLPAIDVVANVADQADWNPQTAKGETKVACLPRRNLDVTGTHDFLTPGRQARNVADD